MTHSFPATSLPRVALLGLGAAALVVVVFRLRRRKHGAPAREQPRQDGVVADERGEEEIQLVEQIRDDVSKHRPSPCVYGQAACCPTGAVSEEEQQQLKQGSEQEHSFDEAPGSVQRMGPSPCVYGEAACCPAGAVSEEEQQQLKHKVEQDHSLDQASGSIMLSDLEEVQQPPQTAESFFIRPSPCVPEESASCPAGTEEDQQQLKQELEQHHSCDAALGSSALTEPEEVQQTPQAAERFFIESDDVGPSPCVYEEAACCPTGAGSEEEQQQLKQELERHDSLDVATVSGMPTAPEEAQQPPQTAERFFIGNDNIGSDNEVCASSQRQAQLFHIGSDLYEAADSGAEAGTDTSLCFTPAEDPRRPLEQEAAARIQRWFRKHARLWQATSTLMGECRIRKETCLHTRNMSNESSEYPDSMTPTARSCIAEDGPVGVPHDTQQGGPVAALHDAHQALQEAFKIVLARDDLKELAKESFATDTTQALNQAVEAITSAKAGHLVQTLRPDSPMSNVKSDAKQTAGQSPERSDSARDLQIEEPEKEVESVQTLEYTKEQLTNPKIWRNLQVNPTERETMLPDSTFRELFQMEKEAFSSLPKWKRDIQKKKLGLF